MPEPDATPAIQRPDAQEVRVVQVDISAIESAEGARTMVAELSRAADRGAPFAAVVQMPSSAKRPKRINGVGERVRMLKELRPRLRESCAGLAFVLSAEAQAANSKAIKAGAKLWGCPTYATDDLVAATDWAVSQLAGRGGSSSVPSEDGS